MAKDGKSAKRGGKRARNRRSRIDRLVEEAQTGRVERMKKNQQTDKAN